ncbi:MAG: cbb3-type cytochrome c oxidase subunit 3 [Silicimonas sp.]|nr:cbb3-type cytochrome c oxidase subunit 3 [Silicimonas sp.]RZW05944.1 MAG: cbb3-type cytochrome c oxidase subunit 3 [Paracoccaceae bacterium]MBT8425846.1 cbb3-type cytochrome c oxidase subunit 3 [Silicimonas sp.]NND17931.1 cbb3-type cytochrome c oxidase subunit 3 [Silicimonas sp.]NND22543.1 cbb3-type cytochrome c oxidase subunit 3 [Silicimonas sp.]
MDTYSILRQIADSWVLLALVIFFLGTVVWAFRPGSKSVHRDTSNIPFRHENRPAGAGEDHKKRPANAGEED